MERTQNQPEIIYHNGKPTAVIIDIDQYQEMLEQLEDFEDLRELEEIRKKPLEFRKLDEFLKEYSSGVYSEKR